MGPPFRISYQAPKNQEHLLLAWLNYDTIFVFEKYRAITCVRRVWSPALDGHVGVGPPQWRSRSYLG